MLKYPYRSLRLYKKKNNTLFIDRATIIVHYAQYGNLYHAEYGNLQ